MSNRIAFYITKEELEAFFQISTDQESLYTAHYNLAPGQRIPLICRRGDEIELTRARWGFGDFDPGSTQHEISGEEALEGIQSGKLERVVIPVSGYYLWKQSGKRAKYPFFVRMLHLPVMALAGVSASEGQEDGRNVRTCALLKTESNALIQPLSADMPLQCTAEHALQWLDPETSAENLLEEMTNRFSLTDLTVHRVSDKVNDLSANNPKLVQPLPK
ncbi:MAG: SOS response-associated peptidase family protein [Balneolaceae bacterium]